MGAMFLQPADGQTYTGGSYRRAKWAEVYDTPGFFGNNFYLTWDGTGCRLVRYRTALRAADDGSGAEVWADYPNTWTTVSLTGHKGVMFDSTTQLWSTPFPVTAASFVGGSDAMRVEVQTAACNTSGTQTGEWETTTLLIYYLADPSIVSAYLDPLTLDVRVTVDTGASRPVKGASITRAYVPERVDITGTTFEDTGSGDVIITIPAASAAALHESGDDVMVSITTADNKTVSARLSITITVDPESSALEEPEPTFTEGDAVLSVSVPHSEGGGGLVEYSDVSLVYSWTDARGVGVTDNIALVLDDDEWVGEIVAPPHGAAVSYTVIVAGLFAMVHEYKSVSGSVTTEQRAVVDMVSDSGVYIPLGFNVKFTVSTDIDAQAITLASGRAVSRHGPANETTVSVSGTVLPGDSMAFWLDAYGAITGAEDWSIRTPDGERYHVALTSFSPAAEVSRYRSYSIKGTEVV